MKLNHFLLKLFLNIFIKNGVKIINDRSYIGEKVKIEAGLVCVFCPESSSGGKRPLRVKLAAAPGRKCPGDSGIRRRAGPLPTYSHFAPPGLFILYFTCVGELFIYFFLYMMEKRILNWKL